MINKGLTEEVILDGAGQAFEGGWNRVKLYFMLGQPTETEEDMKGLHGWLRRSLSGIMRCRRSREMENARSW